MDAYSDFNRFKRVTARIFRFVENCRKGDKQNQASSSLSTLELRKSEWELFITRKRIIRIYGCEGMRVNKDIHNTGNYIVIVWTAVLPK